MAGETLFRKTIPQSRKDVVRVDLPLGTEVVQDVVTAGTIAIILAPDIDITESGYIDAVISEIADAMRELQYT